MSVTSSLSNRLRECSVQVLYSAVQGGSTGGRVSLDTDPIDGVCYGCSYWLVQVIPLVPYIYLYILVELQRWRTAFEYGQQLTDKYRSVMGPHSPIFSLHFLKLLKLAHLIGQDSSTIGKEAIQHLTITHGTSHKLTKKPALTYSMHALYQSALKLRYYIDVYVDKWDWRFVQDATLIKMCVYRKVI